MKINEHVNLARGSSKLLLTMPHSGTCLPDIPHKLDLEKDYVRKAMNARTDYCVPFVTGFHEQDEVSKVWTTLTALAIDVNRGSDNVDKYSLDGATTQSNPHGLIWRASAETDVKKIRDLLTAPYRREELQELMELGWHPYIDNVREEMFRLKAEHGIAINFALHSMPNSIPSQVRDGKYKNAYLFSKPVERGLISEGKMPDFVLLDRGEDTCSPEISDLVMETFQDYNFLIERNHVAPSSITSPRTYINPKKGLHFLGIEVVGHTFEPKRMQGALEYNPQGEAEVRDVFNDVFEKLKNY